jgi:siroheme synthase-like protein
MAIVEKQAVSEVPKRVGAGIEARESRVPRGQLEPREPLSPRVSARSGELYPVFLNLHERPCLVVGGGPVALQKTIELLRAGAHVHVVAKEWRADFSQLGRAAHPAGTRAGQEEPGDAGGWSSIAANLERAGGRLLLSSRPFAPSDLRGVALVIAATGDRAAQEAIYRGATELGILCNVVDVPELCTFQVPANLRRGALTVAVSTEGKSPLLAVGLRDRLASLLPFEIAPALERLAEAKRLVRALHPEPADQPLRRRLLVQLVTGEAIDQLMKGDLEGFEAHWNAWKSSLSA